MKPIKTVQATSFSDQSFPLRFTLATVTDPVPPHLHEVHELIIILEGVAEHQTEYGSYQVGAGSVIYVEPGMMHAYKYMHGITFANIVLIPERLLHFVPHIETMPGYRALFGPRPRPRKSPVHFILPSEALPVLTDILHRINAELAQRAPGFEAGAQSLLMYAVMLLCRYYQLHRGARATKTPEQIERVLRYIDTHYAEPLDVEALAKLAGLSPSQFFTAFKRYNSFSPLQYLIRTRIQHAQELLHEPERSITEVAFAVGFEDSNYFTRQFRKYVHITPREYRQKIKHAL